MQVCLPVFSFAQVSGDTTGDGQVDIRDIPAQINAALGVADPANPDCNADGIVNEQDLTCVLSILLTDEPPVTQLTSSPARAETGIAVTRETVINFSQPLATNVAIQADQLVAKFGGDRLPGRLQLSADRKKLTLFYSENLPSNARISVTLDAGGLRDVFGNVVDGNADGIPGGNYEFQFDTLGLTVIEGTRACGRVFASSFPKVTVA